MPDAAAGASASADMPDAAGGASYGVEVRGRGAIPVARC